jgi:hypothetical protein
MERLTAKDPMQPAAEIIAQLQPSLQQQIATVTPKGPTLLTTEPKVKCQICRDSGWEKIGDRMRRCPCWTDRIIAATLPARFWTSMLSDFPFKIGTGAADWFSHPTDGLFICGPTGSGKTRLAAALTRMAIEQGKRIKFARASDFYAALRNSYNAPEGEPTERAVLWDHQLPYMLVLDDLGAGGLSDHERRFALELLDSRINSLRPTIVTSNWTVEEIAEKMDERIGSRLKSFTVLAMVGKDRRAK